MRHHKYPKTVRYEQAVKDINELFEYRFINGKNSNPKFTVKGTVKIHGSNVGISYDGGEELEVQSRNNKLSLLSDMGGVVKFVEANTDKLLPMFKNLYEYYNINKDTHFLCVYGEWAGGNVQRGVMVSGLEKFFVAFRVAVCNKIGSITAAGETDYLATYYDVEDKLSTINTLQSHGFYTTEDFPTYEVEVDILNPQLAGNIMEDLTLQVENNCPVGTVFRGENYEGNTIGEGIVWKVELHGKTFRWKTKGVKHAGGTKPKVAAYINVKDLEEVNNLIIVVCPEWRMLQSVEEQGIGYDQSKTGLFLKWLVNDILEEEKERLELSGFPLPRVKKLISQYARKWYFSNML